MQSKDEKEEVVVVEVQVFQVGSGIEYDLVFKYLHGIAHLGHDCFLDVYSSLKSTLGAN
jgi:mannitol/fructose-specific phosphotransferase system IIA component